MFSQPKKSLWGEIQHCERGKENDIAYKGARCRLMIKARNFTAPISLSW